MQSDDSVKEWVEVIEQVDHLDGLTESWDGGEAHDVAEVERNLLEMLGLDRFAGLQCLGHRPKGERASLKVIRAQWFNYFAILIP